MKRRVILSLLFLGAGSFLGCGKHDQPNFVYMPDMAYSPSVKGQEEAPGSMRTPPAGSISQNKEIYAYATDPEKAGRELHNPVPRTLANFKKGKEYFNIYCIVCHGAGAEGDGTVVPKFPRPPSLHSDKVRGWSDGRIYHVITMGQNLMPSYASQVPSLHRWQIIHYLRALQRSKNPTDEDLKKAENW